MIETPQHAMITREEAQKRQREAKHHTVVCEGEYAAHYVHDQATGITTLVREAKRGFGRYIANLKEVCGGDLHPLTATARQRAEAFLKTIGKRDEVR
jgi:hypothetical protein